jgi:hypothetical protein
MYARGMLQHLAAAAAASTKTFTYNPCYCYCDCYSCAQQLEDSIAVYVGPYGGYLEKLSPETSSSESSTDGQSSVEVEDKKPVRCKLPQDLHADVELITADAVQYCIELSSAGN